jgi:hypothetical protein
MFISFCWRYNTFSGYPPEVVKKMPKKDLAEEVSLLLFYGQSFTILQFYSLKDYKHKQ